MWAAKRSPLSTADPALVAAERLDRHIRHALELIGQVSLLSSKPSAYAADTLHGTGIVSAAALLALSGLPEIRRWVMSSVAAQKIGLVRLLLVPFHCFSWGALIVMAKQPVGNLVYAGCKRAFNMALRSLPRVIRSFLTGKPRNTGSTFRESSERRPDPTSIGERLHEVVEALKESAPPLPVVPVPPLFDSSHGRLEPSVSATKPSLGTVENAQESNTLSDEARRGRTVERVRASAHAQAVPRRLVRLRKVENEDLVEEEKEAGSGLAGLLGTDGDSDVFESNLSTKSVPVRPTSYFKRVYF